MKNLLAVLFCLAGAICYAQEPSLVVVEPTLDLGVMPSSSRKTFEFTLKNQGKDAVNILGIRPACGCTNVAPPKSSLAPGESMKIKATMNGTGFAGKLTKVIDITSDDLARPHFQWRFLVEVEPLFTASTRPLVLQVEEGAKGEIPYRLVFAPSKSGLKVASVAFMGTSDWLLTESHKQTGGIMEGVVTFDPSLQPRTADQTRTMAQYRMVVTLENGESDYLPVVVQLRRLVTLAPQVAVLDALVGYGGAARVAVVASEPFQVVEVLMSSSKVTAMVQPHPGNPNGVMVDFTMPAGMPVGRYGENLTIKTNSKRFPTIQVPVFIQIREK